MLKQLNGGVAKRRAFEVDARVDLVQRRMKKKKIETTLQEGLTTSRELGAQGLLRVVTQTVLFSLDPAAAMLVFQRQGARTSTFKLFRPVPTAFCVSRSR